MIKVAVCDDEEQVCIKLKDITKTFFNQIERPVWVAEFRDGNALLKSNIHFDIIFLDIDMPEIDGIETAKRLRTWDVNSKIIYVTHYSHYKGKAYKVHAFDYIKKPIMESDILDVLKEVVYYLDNASIKHKYAFTTEDGILTLDLDDIYYIEYSSRKVVINTSQGKYIAVYSLKELIEKLKQFNFLSPHKSFIVNMIHIKCIKGFDIFMENGEVIPLGQKRAAEFKTRFNDYLQSTFDKI